jgi:tyrosyl-tRNA synthetase
MPDFGDILTRGVDEIIVEAELREKLISGKKLRLKEGFDPSFPDIHLGHIVSLRKLRQFQQHGHQVVLIVGDWTAQIGDPSGASRTRPMLTAEQVRANAETYMQQFFKVVDKSLTEVRWQTEWFGDFTLRNVIELTSRFTVAQMLARDDFANRYQNQQPISVTELLYPMLQAYDSVMVEADVEFGGTDQRFNLLVGRDLMKAYGVPPQSVLTVPLLEGTDGVRKMSKSLGNYIGVADPPNEMFGKTMSIPDDLTLQYFELLSDISSPQLAEYRREMAAGTLNPMELKKTLGRELVTQLHDAAAAVEAEANFVRTVQNKELPDEIPEVKIAFNPTPDGSCDIARIIIATGQCQSMGQAKRLIDQGGVSIDGEKLAGKFAPLASGAIIKVGKRNVVKIINSDE